jgi:hypothetical protein
MANNGIKILIFCEIALLLLILVNDYTGFRKFIVWLMFFIIFPIIAWLHSEKKIYKNKEIMRNSMIYQYGENMGKDPYYQKVILSKNKYFFKNHQS